MSKKGKIVLFESTNFSSTRPYQGSPLALLSISRILDKEGYEIKIITPFLYENFLEKVIEEMQDAICLGVSAITGYAIYEGLLVSKEVKKRNPFLPVIWGGWHPSILPKETCVNENIDIVVKGQGERTFTELVHALEKKKSLKNVLGIVYKEKKGKIIENPDRPLESLDDFPPLPFHLIDVEKVINSAEYGNRSLEFFTSCGCPHRCIFCVEPIVNKRRWVGLSPEKAVSEIAVLKKRYNLDSIRIIDSNFFISEERAKKFSEELLRKKINIKWGNVNGRTRQMSLYKDETWKLMKESGLSCIFVGAESGDNKILNFMRKDISVKDTLKLTKICAKYQIRLLASFLVGFPQSNDPEKCHKLIENEIMSSFDLIDKMFSICSNIRVMFALYLPYPSSGLFENSKKLGLELPQSLEDWSNYLIAAEDATKIKVRQKWIVREQAKIILMASVYIFFFLDSDSFKLTTRNIKNKYLMFFLHFGFESFSKICSLRWKYRYFGLPIDFYFYNFLRKYSGLG